MEIGIGIHGEPGVHRGPLETADAVTERLVGAIATDLALARGDRVAVLVNGLGATPLEELYILYRRAARCSAASASRSTGRTSASSRPVSRWRARRSRSCRLDDRLTALLDAPAHVAVLPAVSGGGPRAPGTARQACRRRARTLLDRALLGSASAPTSCATSTPRSATAISA